MAALEDALNSSTFSEFPTQRASLVEWTVEGKSCDLIESLERPLFH